MKMKSIAIDTTVLCKLFVFSCLCITTAAVVPIRLFLLFISQISNILDINNKINGINE